MAGNRRIVVGNIAQSKVRGKALGDALYNQLNHEEKVDGSMKKKVMKKPYGKKK